MAGNMIRTRAESLPQQLFLQFRHQIESGALRVGDRLPSIRAAAEDFGVSKNTVVEAYERLVSAGLVTPRHGSGFMVNSRSPGNGDARPRHVSEAVDIVSLLNAQLEQSYTIRAGDGRPPPNWTGESELRRHLGPGGHGSNMEAYGVAQGFRKLRELIAISFSERGISIGPDQILLTLGANHALDLVIRHFLSPGDAVLVDEPGYYPLFAKLRLAQIQIQGVRRTPSGPDPEHLENQVRAHQPKLFFTQSFAHNPTGSSIDLPTAHAVLSIADRCGLRIIENDPFKDLMAPGDILLSSIDQFKSVIFVGTFAKTLSASLRSGYIAADPKTISSITDLKMVTIVNSSGHVESVVSNIIANGHYRRHIKRLKERISNAVGSCKVKLSEIGLEPFAIPRSGYYMFPSLPLGTDDIALARRASNEGIFLAPGSLFHIDQMNSCPSIRINIGRADDDRLFEFIKRSIT